MNGKQLASRSKDLTIRIWDMHNQACLIVFNQHKINGLRVTWNIDRGLIFEGDNHTINVWDVEKQACVKVFEGHKNDIESFAWSIDGKQLASGSMDKTIRIWNVEGQGLIKILNGHTDYVKSVVWSSNDKWLISSSENEIYFWNPKNWNAIPCRLPIGAQALSLWDTYLGLVHNGAIHVIDISQEFPDRVQWIMAFMCSTCLEGCDINGARNVSLANQNLFKAKNFLNNVEETEKHTPFSFLTTIRNTLFSTFVNAAEINTNINDENQFCTIS